MSQEQIDMVLREGGSSRRDSGNAEKEIVSLKLLRVSRGLLTSIVTFLNLIVRDVIPSMLIKQTDICPLACVIINIQIKTPATLKI